MRHSEDNSRSWFEWLMPSTEPERAATPCIIPLVAFGGTVFDDAEYFLRRLLNYIKVREVGCPADNSDVEEILIQNRQKRAFVRILTDRRMGRVYDELLQYERTIQSDGAPIGFRYQAGEPEPNDIDRVCCQYDGIIRLLGTVLAHAAHEHSDAITRSTMTKFYQEISGIHEGLATQVVSIEKVHPNSPLGSGVQKAAEAYGLLDSYLATELKELPLPERMPRVAYQLYSFVEDVSEANHSLFGHFLPAVIAELANVIGIGQNVTRKDIDNILRRMRRK